MTESGERETNALILDPFAGISGDMLVGALVDLGLGVEWLNDFVDGLELGASLVVESVDRSGITCTRVRFELPEERGHRHLKDVLAIVQGRDLPAPVVEGATRVFERLAGVEAAIHGVPVERVHFHEVGALDSILDVLCVMAGVEKLGYTRFFARPVAVGTGSIEIEHGRYPLPAPATARLLEGLAVTETGFAEECTTPTGAALLAELTGGQTPPSRFRWGRTGYGAGSRNPPGRPNCLRLVECRMELDGGADDAGETLRVVQADIDDLAPEYVAAARDAVMAAGAVDATLVRVEMKKGRPGVRLEALVPESYLAVVVETLFRGTTTLGIRHWPVDRRVLERDVETVEWRGHTIRMKATRIPGGGVRRKPEFDDVVAAARETGLTPHEVRLELDAAGRGRAPDQ